MSSVAGTKRKNPEPAVPPPAVPPPAEPAQKAQRAESPPTPELRFQVGDEVKCNVGGGKWEVGVVSKLWYRESDWPASRPSAPYQITLSGGRIIWAPADQNSCITTTKPKVPVTILTGFLGAGKTTLLNHILSENHGKKIGIIENEFGAVSIDDKLIKQGQKRATDEVVIEMKNGCICCTVRQDLTTALKDMFKGGRTFDSIIIETTGMADPAPVIQTFCVDEFANTYLELDATITVVDAKHIEQHIDDEEYKKKGADFENESVEQIAFADRVLLNKTDLLEEKTRKESIKRIEGRIHEINKSVEIIPCTLKEKLTVDLDRILGIKAFDLKAILKIEPTFLTDDGADHVHNPNINSFTMRYPGSVDMERLEDWLQSILMKYNNEIYRMKGFLSVDGSPEKFVFQGVHMIFQISPTDCWKDGEKRENLLVFIGKQMKDREKAFRESFEKCLVKKN